MNRNELVTQTQLNIKTLNEILDGLSIPKNTEDYTDEQLKLVQAIQEIRKDEKVQSWPEAITIYRKSQNAHQLNEIALRHSITAERIPEIVAALKLKIEALAEPQFELFREVCQAMQSGVELPLAAQMTLDKGKATKGKKSVQPAEASKQAVEQPQSEASHEGAIAVIDRDAAIQFAGDSPGELMFEIPEKVSENMDSLAKKSAIGIAEDYIKGATVQILEQDSNEAFRQGRQYGQRLIEKARREVLQDPAAQTMVQRVIAQVKKELGRED